MGLPSGLLRRVFGAEPSLEIEIRAVSPPGGKSKLTEVCLIIRPTGCGRAEGAQALEKFGPPLIDGLRKNLNVGPERRRTLRLPYSCRVLALPLLPDGRVGEGLEGEGKDISLEGIGLYLADKPPSKLLLRLCPSGADAPVDVPAEVVRVVPADTGRYEVGLRFALPDAAGGAP
jgi:hypothetical protein